MDRAPIHVGTCSWSEPHWRGAFYSAECTQADYLIEYSRQFSSVEIDSTFYGIPRPATVKGWHSRTPDDFIFSAKAPKAITHEKFLVDCAEETQSFLQTISLLGDKLGPIVFQFPYFAKRKGVTVTDFMERLGPFLAALPKEGFRFAIEVRNKTWIAPPLLELLAAHDVTLALIDHPWMWRPRELFKIDGILTGSFVYIRWLGDRKGIKELTTTFDYTVLDRTAELEDWAESVNDLLSRNIPVYGYANNHYSGYSPADVRKFAALVGVEMPKAQDRANDLF